MDAAATSEVLAKVVAELPGGGEVREGQRMMAEVVSEALQNDKHLVVQAGTGTGKSLAYLVPAILSGKRVVVATATKALQDQLANKDLPFLAEHLDEPFVWSVLKGRSNYLCKQRLAEMEGVGDQLTLDDGSPVGGSALQVRRLVEWSRQTVSGDRAELDFEPAHRVWSSMSVGPMECPGAAKCPKGEVCFSEDARRMAYASTIIVVNLHLYGLHLASNGSILPEHDAVIIDEAHQFEDVLSSAAGLEFGAGRFASLGRNARPALDGDDLTKDVADTGGTLADLLAERVGDRLRSLDEDLTMVLDVAMDRVNRLVAEVRTAPDEHDALKARVLSQAGHLLADLDLLRRLPETHVVWVEGPTRSPSLRMAPIDVAEFLNESLWPHQTAVMTSATVDLEIGTRLGLREGAYDAHDVGSPFDYESQALLYCPMHLPEPRNAGWLDAVTDELEVLVKAAGGRTLALFTSWRAMETVAEELDPRVDYEVLTQRDLPKPALIERFMDDESSVLCATMGFWQGVDIPGRALSLVTIDRLPFPRPDEPLLQARRDRAGPQAFSTIDLPRAATMLAQGTGRLIRTADDVGVVAVLDTRLGTANYRWTLVNALPPMKRTRHQDEAVAFLEAIRGSDD
jgi:ATP-dependent DNA helicase DinG